jgi:hypothetical protein
MSLLPGAWCLSIPALTRYNISIYALYLPSCRMESGMTGMDITDTHQNVQTESLNAQAPTAPTAPSQPVTSGQ